MTPPTGRPPRALSAADVPGVVALAAAVGWDYGEAELATALAAGRMVGVDGPEGGLVACAGLFAYGAALASLGLVIVHPAAQGRGLGKAVTAAAVDLAGDRPVILAATEAGRPLYAGLGFREIGTLHKLIAPRAAGLGPPSEGVRTTDPDPAALLALDAAARGASRAAFLRARLVQAADRAWLPGADGRPVGFALAIPGPVVRVIGPVVAPDAAAAWALAATLAGRHAGALRIDVPSQHAGLVTRLMAHGFALDRVVPVMALRPERVPPGDGTLFAIAAQAYG